MAADRTLLTVPTARPLEDFLGEALQVTSATDVYPAFLAHKQGAETGDGRLPVPSCWHEEALLIQPPAHHLQEHAAGVLIGQCGNLPGLGGSDLDGAAIVHAEAPLDHVEGMYGVAGEVAAAEISAEVPGHDVRGPAVRMKTAVVRAPGRRAEPEVPIQAFGHRLGRQTDVAARARMIDVDDAYFPDRTSAHQVAGLMKLGGGTLLQAALEHPTVASDRVDHGPRLADGQRDGFLAVDVLAGLGRHDRGQGVPAVAGCDKDGVDVFAGQENAEVVACLTAPIRAGGALLGVSRLDGGLGMFAAPPVHVADGDNLGIRILQAAPDVALAHHAGADEAKGDAVAGCGRALPAERR